ncbi:MAG: RNA polymerase sigma factor [Marinilabiliales bacterium]|nr:MAG: RNA polymerase sigma factor [Marinilabiliales bacterium]
MSVCLRYSYSREDAIEILNDGFMKVYNNIGVYDDSKPFRSWFRKILVNTAIDHHRANRQNRLRINAYDTAEEIDQVHNTADLPGSETTADAEAILALFDRLPGNYRMIFNLYEVEGYNHDEIAGMLGISPGTSRSALSRAKALIRALYNKNIKDNRHEAV